MKKSFEWVKMLRPSYPRRSIRFIISLSFTVIAVLGMLFIGMILYSRFTVMAQRTVEEDTKLVLEQVNLNLDNYLRNMMRISDAMYYRVIKNKDIATESLSDEMNLLYQANSDLLVSISVFSEDGSVIASTPLSAVKSTANPTQQQWFISATQKIENLHFSTPHVQNLFEDPDNRYRWVTSLSRSVELTENGDIQRGVLLVDMNFSGIEQLFSTIKLGENGYVYLVDSEGKIIYHPRQQLIYSSLLKESNLDVVRHEDGNYIEDFEGESRLITVKTAGYTGWKIVAVAQMSDLTQKNFQLQFFALATVMISGVMLVCINLFVSEKIADPIQKLEESVKEIENGMLDITIPADKGSYEIRHLAKSVNMMVKRMKELMEEIVVEHEEKRKSELDALQSQINPHFLYNTLDSVVWMIENERYDGAVTMVTSLARLFRISISKGKTIITVVSELEHAKNYLTIQQIRYKNKFTFTIICDADCAELATIKLIIQPLIENSINHGVEFTDGDGEIVVHAYRHENELFIDVEDNGIGIPQAEVQTLLTDKHRHSSSGSSGIGLRNVHERIRLYFGNQYGLTIFSEPDVGTRIRVCIPAVPKSDITDDGTYHDGK